MAFARRSASAACSFLISPNRARRAACSLTFAARNRAGLRPCGPRHLPRRGCEPLCSGISSHPGPSAPTLLSGQGLIVDVDLQQVRREIFLVVGTGQLRYWPEDPPRGSVSGRGILARPTVESAVSADPARALRCLRPTDRTVNVAVAVILTAAGLAVQR